MRPEIIIPKISCEHLSEFNRSNFEFIVNSFPKDFCISLSQTWLYQREPDFLSTEVCVGRTTDKIFIMATIPDLDIFTCASEPNQKTWELGDVFEIFLKPESGTRYCELHVTPANTRTQLAFSAEGAAPEILPDGIFDSLVCVESSRWIMLASIPSEVVTNRSSIHDGEHWRFSFCRYDAFGDGRNPILSSSSPHPVPKFHRPNEWGVMVF